MPDVTIEELSIPATLDSPGGDDFASAVELGNVVDAHGYGVDDLAERPEEVLPRWHNPFEPSRMLLARKSGRIVGSARYEIHLGEEAEESWLYVCVHPEFRSRGIGTALADAIEELPRQDGKTIAIAYAVSPDSPGETIPAPTGFGSVPAGNDEVRFLLGRGYALEQVERASRLPLPVDDVADRLASAVDASGPDYRVHSWVGPVDERWRDDLAVLLTRMSTDAPSAGLGESEDVWTAERLVQAEVRFESSPLTRLTSAVEHIPTGILVGYTDLIVPLELDRAVDQQGTIVLDGHRGHRLGMLLKVANLAFLQESRPGHPSIVTFNAEENRHMLSVNEEVGFAAFAYEGAWRKNVTR